MFAARTQLLTPAAPSGTHLTDIFGRADAADLGASYTNRNGAMGIASNTAIPKTNNTYCAATHNTVMTADDMTVSITLGSLVGSGTSTNWPILGANTGGTSYAMAYVAAGAPQILSVTNWNWVAGFTSQASSGSNLFATGDVIGLQRVGNVYTLLKNGVTTGVTWTDGSNVVTRGGSNRLVGLGGLVSSLNCRAITAFAADSA